MGKKIRGVTDGASRNDFKINRVYVMNRFTSFVLILTLVGGVALPLGMAATTGGKPADRSPAAAAAPIATAISTVTGIAISPLLGTSGYGAYRWFTAKDAAARAALPWFAQLSFWLPALLIVGICALKDSLGAVLPPGLKKPLDVLETMENKFSGLVAAGAVIPFTMDTLSKILVADATTGGAVPWHGLAMIQFAGIDWSWLVNVLTVPFGVAVFALVWMASHAINVLILLSPWGAIDAGLKAMRAALLGFVTMAATINPWVGAALSLALVVVAYFVAGWAFRLTVFGSVFCWDFFTRRRNRFAPAETDNAMFSAAQFADVPVRTYGRLVRRTQGGLEFVYRPWLCLPVRVAQAPVEASGLFVGEGMFFSDLVTPDERTLFSLPPRYRGHEATLARAYGMSGVRPAGLHKAWSALRDLLGGKATRQVSP
ncbi:MAG: hypothetical protein RIQ93_204 [Verrucomicrobiota bacterium]